MSLKSMRPDSQAAVSGLVGPSQERYSRQVLFSGIGIEGQRKLETSHVAIVGCGATGAAAASLLARAGLGTLTVIDRDYVEESNLQRQVLFDEADAAQYLPKAEAAKRKLHALNRAVEVRAHVADLVPSNIHALLEGADLVLDGTDNFETRYLLNEYAVQQNQPWIYAAAIGAYAATLNVLPGDTACLACLFPVPPSGTVETCDTAGILNTAVNFVASIQVTEALKLLVGDHSAIRRSLISYDLWTGESSEISSTKPRSDCQVCALRDFSSLRGENRPQITLCGRNSVQIHEHSRPIDFAELQTRLEKHGSVRVNNLLLRFQRGEQVITLFKDGRALIQGTTDVMKARSLYARFIGS